MIGMLMHDTTLTCDGCGQEFTFTMHEQLSYARSGQGKPSRCAFCRAAHMMAGGTRGPVGGGDHGERSTRAQYSVVCDQCGRPTMVPFEPRGNRPVYCPSCFRSHREGGGYGGARSRTESIRRR
jgi:CxxC-x17-CxxC domain-containing protein